MRNVTFTRMLPVLVALTLLGISGPATAQDDPQYLVQIIKLKWDMADEWRELQEGVIVPALKEVGVPTRTVLETLLGDRPEFVTIRPIDSLAEFDGDSILVPALGQREYDEVVAQLNSYQISAERLITTRLSDFDVGVTTGPVRVTTWYKVNPGAGPLHRAFLTNEVIPVMQQAVQRGLIGGYSMSTLGLGAPEAGLWSQSVYLPNVAALDAGNAANQILGDAGVQALGARASQLRTTVRTVVRRVVPELGYTSLDE